MENAEQYKNALYQRTSEIESRASHGLDIQERYEKEANLALRSADVRFAEGDRILDLACGAGGHANVMRKKTGVDIDAMDISKPLLEIAQRHEVTALQGGVRGKINFLEGSYGAIKEKVPGNATYKLVTILGSSFMYLDTPEAHQKALRDYFDVLAPGGKMVIQFRDRGDRQYDAGKRTEWGKKLGVERTDRKVEWPHGKFGQHAHGADWVTQLKDAAKGDGFYFYGAELTEEQVRQRHLHKKTDEKTGQTYFADADEVPHYSFGRTYVDASGDETDLGTTTLIDYTSEKSFPVLKRMLEKAGYRNVDLKSEPLSPDGAWRNFAVVAEKPLS